LAGVENQTFIGSKFRHAVVNGYKDGVVGHKLVPVPRGFWNSRGVSEKAWSPKSMAPIPHLGGSAVSDLSAAYRKLAGESHTIEATYDDVSVTIVRNFDIILAAEVTASNQLVVDGRCPGLVDVKIGDCEAIDVSRWQVDVGIEEHVIDLGVEVDATETNVYLVLA
jgi:hypothetical protein